MSAGIHSIIEDWKREAKITHIMLYKLHNHELTIFTDCPGRLIGFRGELVAKYEAKLKDIKFQSIKELKIVETTGIV